MAEPDRFGGVERISEAELALSVKVYEGDRQTDHDMLGNETWGFFMP